MRQHRRYIEQSLPVLLSSHLFSLIQLVMGSQESSASLSESLFTQLFSRIVLSFRFADFDPASSHLAFLTHFLFPLPYTRYTSHTRPICSASQTIFCLTTPCLESTLKPPASLFRKHAVFGAPAPREHSELPNGAYVCIDHSFTVYCHLHC